MPSKLKIIYPLILLCLSLAGTAALPLGLSAAEEITVDPARIPLLVEPGDSFEESIKVTNNADTPKKFYAYLRDFAAEGEEGRARLIVPGTESGSFLSTWIKSSSEGMDFAPGESKEFKFSITVPKEAGPGGYYGAIVFGTKAPEVRQEAVEKGAAIGISQQAGSLILLQIAGQADERAQIRDFVTDKRAYNTPFSVAFATRVENQGNVHIRPQGTIEISNLLGKTVATLKINDKAANILPKSIRRFDNTWAGNFGFGRYKAVLALSYGTSAADRGAGMQSLTSIRYFWILPAKLLIFAGISLLLLIAIIFVLLKFYKNRAIKEAMKGMGVGKEVYVKKTAGGSPTAHLSLIIIVISALVLLLAAGAYFLFFA